MHRKILVFFSLSFSLIINYQKLVAGELVFPFTATSPTIVHLYSQPALIETLKKEFYNDLKIAFTPLQEHLSNSFIDPYKSEDKETLFRAIQCYYHMGWYTHAAGLYYHHIQQDNNFTYENLDEFAWFLRLTDFEQVKEIVANYCHKLKS